MAYNLSWQRRPPRRDSELRQPTLSELALEEMKKKAEPEPPFGGWGGEFVVPRPPEPPPITWGPALVIPAPDWAAEEREREEQQRAVELERARALLKENAPEEPT